MCTNICSNICLHFRFLGLQIFFICGGFVSFLLTFLVLRKLNLTQQQDDQNNDRSKHEDREMKDVKQLLSSSNGQNTQQSV